MDDETIIKVSKETNHNDEAGLSDDHAITQLMKHRYLYVFIQLNCTTILYYAYIFSLVST
jgi:hypothetical protein